MEKKESMKETEHRKFDSSDIAIGIINLTMLIALIMDFIHGPMMNGIIGLIAIALVSFFHLCWKKGADKLVPRGIYIFAMVFISISVFWSNHLDLYKTFFFHDIALHFASGVLVVLLMGYLLPKRILEPMTMAEKVILFMVAAIAVAGGWEMIEFFTDMVMHSDVQRNFLREWEFFSTTWQNPAIIDSMNDMINGTMGGALGCIIYWLKERKSRKD